MTAATEFDLRGMIRAELAETDESDPHILAREIAAKIPEVELRGVVEHFLAGLVRETIGSQRAGLRTIISRPEPEASSQPSKGRWLDAGEVYQRFLRQRECVSLDGGKREWKLLGEMTRDDVLGAAAIRQANADANRIMAKKYKTLATLMAEHDAALVADLPSEVALAVFR